MTPSPGRVNRGPAAAAENRRALLKAARRLFAAEGYGVALSAIAHAAGVGQGVLYRHFPTRLDLAFAVFEEHFVQLQRIASTPGPDAFGLLWTQMLDFTVEESAFVEMVVDARRHVPEYGGSDRIRRLVDLTLSRAQQAGAADPDLTVDDVLLAWRMAFGVVVTATDATDLRAVVDRALTLGPLHGRRDG
jgi:AcrR family transcriptional regulator